MPSTKEGEDEEEGDEDEDEEKETRNARSTSIDFFCSFSFNCCDCSQIDARVRLRVFPLDHQIETRADGKRERERKGDTIPFYYPGSDRSSARQLVRQRHSLNDAMITEEREASERSVFRPRCLSVCHLISDIIDPCTWWLMPRLLILLSIVSMSILFVLPSISPLDSNASVDLIEQQWLPSVTRKNPNITILMMFPDIDRFIPNLKSLLIVYEYIVHRYEISSWLNVNLQIKDSNCSISLAPHMLVTTMLSTIPDVVFGPFCGEFIAHGSTLTSLSLLI